jgi:TonB family protein
MARKFQVNPYDLLGQAELYPPHIFLPAGEPPKLEIAWDSFHQNFLTNIPVLFQSARFTGAVPLTYVLRDCRVEHRFPRRGLLVAAVAQVCLLLLPWPDLPAAPRKNHAFDNTQLTWSGPIDDLPLLNMPREAKAAPRAKQPDPPPPPGADAFHPRQNIFTDPSRPTHPRQTLVNPAAPPEAPKILPEMPNVVRLVSVSAPPRPQLQINQEALKQFRPHAKKSVATTDAPAPELPTAETKVAEINVAAEQAGPARPKLEINAASAPRVAEKKQEGQIAAPEVVPSASNAPAGAPATLIALSASPAPPAPVVPVPEGNLSARVAISPEGKKPGAPGGVPGSTATSGGNSPAASNTGGGKNPTGIVISGGDPKPTAASVSGLSNTHGFSMSKPQAYLKRPDPNAAVEDEPVRAGPPNFAALPPGSVPEQIFSRRRVYSMNVNMPNFNSATGSWIIHFSELHLSAAASHAGTLASPEPVHKVDPQYPSVLMDQHIEGEVILYAVIRKNGSVDSLQVVRGIDSRLDANAIAAFSEWKFEPATREGQPVDLEAIVHIPFHRPQQQ